MRMRGLAVFAAAVAKTGKTNLPHSGIFETA